MQCFIIRTIHSTTRKDNTMSFKFIQSDHGDMIVCRVSVDCSRTSLNVLEGTGREIIGHRLIEQMPRGSGGEIDVFLFELKSGMTTDEEVDIYCEERGLRVVDPFTLATLNEQNRFSPRNSPTGPTGRIEMVTGVTRDSII